MFCNELFWLGGPSGFGVINVGGGASVQSHFNEVFFFLFGGFGQGEMETLLIMKFVGGILKAFFWKTL